MRMKTLLTTLIVATTITAFSPEEKSNIPTCQTGPEALTDAFLSDGLSSKVPQTCFNFPTNSNEKRCFYTYVPPCAVDKPNVPLVFDIHKWQSCPLISSSYTGWKEKATEECFVVVWPLGVIDPLVADDSCFHVPGGMPTEGGNYTTPNCCCEKDGKFIDTDETRDPEFLREVVLRVVDSFEKSDENTTIDTTRIYMAGHSNGCVASLTMAALSSDIVAAVCCHSGTFLTDVAEDYTPVPVWLAHGLADDELPFNGITFLSGDNNTYRLMSTYYAADYVAEKNGCAENVTIVPVGEDGNRFYRTDCTNNADVELFLLNRSGHYPFLDAEEIVANASVTKVDTTSIAWSFCSSHSKAQIPDVFNQYNTQSSPISPTLPSPSGGTNTVPIPVQTPPPPQPSPTPQTATPPAPPSLSTPSAPPTAAGFMTMSGGTCILSMFLLSLILFA